MAEGKRTVKFDAELGIEAYRFLGLMQKFPNHFHEYYVVGFVESGRRQLTCEGKKYTIETGDLIVFNPLNPHTCEQLDANALDWRCLNIKAEAMAHLTTDGSLPRFDTVVHPHSELVKGLRAVHDMIMQGVSGLEKEEAYFFFMQRLLELAAVSAEPTGPALNDALQAVCAYIEQHYADSLSLVQLSEVASLSKYSLLRHFTQVKGITPYSYLLAVRVNKGKEMLEQGLPPLESAMECGFADQSHFTRCFKNNTGLTPRQYANMFQEEPN